jgi:DUF4097 and DUF4098 domain-containing protein YvlB
MQSQQAATVTLATLMVLATVASAQTKKELHFNLGPKSTVAIINQYGGISVKPAPGNTILVVATLASDKVDVQSSQGLNRVDLATQLLPGATVVTGRVDYEVLVPSDSNVILQSTTGPLQAEKLHGDVEMEGVSAPVDVRDITDAHVHVKTMNGPITLTNIREGHVEIDSVSGDITLNSVSGPEVRVSSTTGQIVYDGDFGYPGEYRLTSHSGNIEATFPQNTPVEIKAQSYRGKVLDDANLLPKKHPSFPVAEGKSFVGTTLNTVNKAAASVWLRTFSGRIHLKKR